MAVYERATQAVQPSEQYDMYNIYIKRAAEIYGVTHTRSIYEKAIEVSFFFARFVTLTRTALGQSTCSDFAWMIFCTLVTIKLGGIREWGMLASLITFTTLMALCHMCLLLSIYRSCQMSMHEKCACASPTWSANLAK